MGKYNTLATLAGFAVGTAQQLADKKYDEQHEDAKLAAFQGEEIQTGTHASQAGYALGTAMKNINDWANQYTVSSDRDDTFNQELVSMTPFAYRKRLIEDLNNNVQDSSLVLATMQDVLPDMVKQHAKVHRDFLVKGQVNNIKDGVLSVLHTANWQSRTSDMLSTAPKEIAQRGLVQAINEGLRTGVIDATFGFDGFKPYLEPDTYKKLYNTWTHRVKEQASEIKHNFMATSNTREGALFVYEKVLEQNNDVPPTAKDVQNFLTEHLKLQGVVVDDDTLNQLQKISEFWTPIVQGLETGAVASDFEGDQQKEFIELSRMVDGSTGHLYAITSTLPRLPQQVQTDLLSNLGAYLGNPQDDPEGYASWENAYAESARFYLSLDQKLNNGKFFSQLPVEIQSKLRFVEHHGLSMDTFQKWDELQARNNALTSALTTFTDYQTVGTLWNTLKEEATDGVFNKDFDDLDVVTQTRIINYMSSRKMYDSTLEIDSDLFKDAVKHVGNSQITIGDGNILQDVNSPLSTNGVNEVVAPTDVVLSVISPRFHKSVSDGNVGTYYDPTRQYISSSLDGGTTSVSREEFVRAQVHGAALVKEYFMTGVNLDSLKDSADSFVLMMKTNGVDTDTVSKYEKRFAEITNTALPEDEADLFDYNVNTYRNFLREEEFRNFIGVTQQKITDGTASTIEVDIAVAVASAKLTQEGRDDE